MKRIAFIIVATLVLPLWSWQPSAILAQQTSSLLSWISSQDVLLVSGPDGRLLYNKNETKQYVPASTLKILTALAAIHNVGKHYRFRTAFYLDHEKNLKIKGYGDPLLVSEVWQEIAQTLAPKLHGRKDLILDDSYFVHDIHIPGVNHSTNPYDAPVGALCANFNTVFFQHDKEGRIVSAEPQTPITPLALKHVRRLGLTKGRYTFTHDSGEAARYAGELFVHFLHKNGAHLRGKIRSGVVGPEDGLLYTYESVFSLEEALKRMLEFSNNFMANQILIALGAHIHGPPGTLDKGVQVASDFAKEVLHLNDIRIVEGSGISRENQLSALDMLAVLRAFEPHRDLLPRKGQVLYKSGALKGLETRAGYIECRHGRPYCFVIFLDSPNSDMDTLIADLAESLDNCLKD